MLLIGMLSSIAVITRSEGSARLALPHRPSAVPSAPPLRSPALSPTPQPLFADTFVDNSKGWYTGTVEGYTRLISNDELTLSATNHKTLIESLPSSTSFDDFSVTMTFRLLQANPHDSVGLYVRGDSTLDHDYRIDIFGDASYAVSKEWLGPDNTQQRTYLVGPTRSHFLQPTGQQNTLTVILKGSSLVIVINGAVVNALTDADYTHGQIALFVANDPASSGVLATFRRIAVELPPDPLVNYPH